MTDRALYPNASFRLTGTLAGHVQARAAQSLTGSVSAAAKRDLDWYYETLAYDLASVTLTEGEAMLILDVCNGTLWESWSARLLWANIDDSLEDGYAEKWAVDGPALVARLRALTPGQSMAIVDAVERWWSLGNKDRTDLAKSLRVVGLTRTRTAQP